MKLREITHRPLADRDYPVLVHRPECADGRANGWEVWARRDRLDAQFLADEPTARVFTLPAKPARRMAGT